MLRRGFRKGPGARMRVVYRLFASVLWIVAALLIGSERTACAQGSVDWPGYQGGPDRNQYSGLDQITSENVGGLEEVWRYSAGGSAQIQCNPLVIDGVLYGTSPEKNLFALNAATGRELWVFEPTEGGRGGGVNRGASYWTDGAARRILYSAGFHLYSVDAASGEVDADFGANGAVDLRLGLREGSEELLVTSNTPGAVFEDLLVVGTRVNEALPAAPGHVRAYDVRTGAIVWTFHSLPQPGELGSETWPSDAWARSGGANSWAGMSVDHARGVVYVPTGSAAYDFYGGDRHGENLFANTLLALDARTGERKWHYQVVRHDLWDRDLPAPPNLVTVEHDGKRIEAVAQITKSAHIFLFDRDTGAPLFPIDEVAAPPSDLVGEAAWPTQPIPRKPAPFSRQIMTRDDVTNISPEANAFVWDRLSRSRSAGQFKPPSREGTIVLPGFDGGGEWGGAAVDPATSILYVNASEMPWMLQMIDLSSRKTTAMGERIYAQHCLYCHGVDRRGDPLEAYPNLLGLGDRLSREEVSAVIRDGRELMPAFANLRSGRLDALLAYLLDDAPPEDVEDTEALAGETPRYGHTGYIRFVDQEGYPAIKPPWGTLTAIDLNSGDHLWQVVLGETPELAARGIPQTGTENYGGPAITKGGVLFIAATKDEMFRAFDMKTGAALWKAKLPAGGYATPSVYAVDGRQFVVIACGGGKMGTAAGDQYVAFALPE